MRYIKVLLLVLIFFLSMVFFFQNQEALSKDMVLRMHLFFMPPMSSIPLPFYFLILVAFLLGAMVTFLVLVWDKMHLSARHMKATWRVRSLEKEVSTLKAAQSADAAPADGKGLSIFSRKPAASPSAPAAASAATPMDDVKAPDPDKHA